MSNSRMSGSRQSAPGLEQILIHLFSVLGGLCHLHRRYALHQLYRVPFEHQLWICFVDRFKTHIKSAQAASLLSRPIGLHEDESINIHLVIETRNVILVFCISMYILHQGDYEIIIIVTTTCCK